MIFSPPAFSARVAIAIFFVAFSHLEVPSATPPPRALQFVLRLVNDRIQRVLSRPIHGIFQLA